MAVSGDIGSRAAGRRVAVVGAGVAGLSAAVELASRGLAVSLIDRAEGIGPAQCSWWAGGMLAPWCERAAAEAAVLDLGRGAIGWWERYTPTLRRNGTLVVAPKGGRAELSRFAARTGGYERIGGGRIVELEPDLEGRFSDALFFPKEGHLDPRQALRDLADAAVGQGVDLRFGTGQVPPADAVIDCRGFAAAPDLDRLRGVRGEMLLVRTGDVRLSRPVRFLHPRHPIYVVPRDDGVFMVGATTVESAGRGRITVRSVLELLGTAYALHPAFGEAEVLETGADLRPAFPDNLPTVLRQNGRIWVNGLYRHGFLLAPAMARQAAEMAAADLVPAS